MIAWFIKLALGNKIKQMFASPVALGAIILCLVILWYYLFNHLPVVRERDALLAYKNQQTIIANAAIIENAKNLEQARAVESLAAVEMQNNIDAILEVSQKSELEIAENFRIEYETRLNNAFLAHRVLSASGDNGREAEITSTGQELAEGERIADTACAGLRAEKETLEEGCALTTEYFNYCRKLLDADALVCERASL